MKITAKVDTKLKKKPIASSLLAPGEAMSVAAGKYYGVDSIQPAANGHSKVVLAYSQGTWFIFDQHWNGLESDDIQAISLIKQFEGYSADAYPDPASGNEPWTIGYGTTRYRNGQSVRPGDRIVQSEAESYLEDEVVDIVTTLQKTVPSWGELTNNQQSALISFAYNLGQNFYGADGFTSMTNMLRSGDWTNARKIFCLYTNQGMTGLVRRRNAEADLFLVCH